MLHESHVTPRPARTLADHRRACCSAGSVRVLKHMSIAKEKASFDKYASVLVPEDQVATGYPCMWPSDWRDELQSKRMNKGNYHEFEFVAAGHRCHCINQLPSWLPGIISV